MRRRSLKRIFLYCAIGFIALSSALTFGIYWAVKSAFDTSDDLHWYKIVSVEVNQNGGKLAYCYLYNIVSFGAISRNSIYVTISDIEHNVHVYSVGDIFERRPSEEAILSRGCSVLSARREFPISMEWTDVSTLEIYGLNEDPELSYLIDQQSECGEVQIEYHSELPL